MACGEQTPDLMKWTVSDGFVTVCSSADARVHLFNLTHRNNNLGFEYNI